MRAYFLEDDLLITPEVKPELQMASWEEAAAFGGRVLFLNNRLSPRERAAFRVNHLSQLNASLENEALLWQCSEVDPSFKCLKEAVSQGRVISVNGAHKDWHHWISPKAPKKHRIHVVGLGDVGGMLLTGLRLLGQDEIGSLGLYDPDPAKCQRWHREIGQICFPFQGDDMKVEILEPEELFNCDLFVFCASRSVPPLDRPVSDVRMVQYEGNAAILKPYAESAVRQSFKGIFAVVSDPVDQLCQFVQKVMEGTAASENLTPLKADQVRGYGLGVMNGRASWYARQNSELASYLEEGRAFGPHGKGLIIANSIDHYDSEKSLRLTDLTLNANIEVRSSGFKPYVAPALSSGAIALLCTLRGQWHYSAVSLGGLFMGCRNRVVQGIQETECLNMPEALKERIRSTCSILRGTL